ncbi:MAG: flagellar biosynthesis protein FliQ [Defluviitaleaceae bacterium]|nr:flagellar biosynthesis protein FliQ [Defluviitaleaceae bacterium]MCL2264114.1 flagellar biosynthesis protein FliQ [Defluviitaleaceae bacterium]
MTQEIVLDIVREGLFTVLLVALPPLTIGLTAGLIMSIFQTITSIQEPTLAFVPKILAVFLAMVVFGPFMLTLLVEYFTGLTSNFLYFIHPVR